ncbi:MAG: selenide, water dikinase SelD [Marinilabiliales bacterium]|nr:selenide, water dikinase SelD [Marinilabiliales bacterium]
MKGFDLLSVVVQGGCSVKLSPVQLEQVLAGLPKIEHPNLMVGIETHDDAGVYRLNDETALIYTTDFFPPVCSDGFEFGQIAAANALSDVYAMGGSPLLALNLMMFPAHTLPLEVFGEILRGGGEKVQEAGALVLGGHTIEDEVPKYGLAVVGTVHPDRLITNAGVREGDLLILTKPLGSGVILAGQRNQLTNEDTVRKALNYMKMLNKSGAEVMQQYQLKGATDVTGFGLLGHARRMAEASRVTIRFNSKWVPRFGEAMDLLEAGCIPGAAFRNLTFVQEAVQFGSSVVYEEKMLCCDAQTSGGLLMAVPAARANELLQDLKTKAGLPDAEIIGEALPLQKKVLYLD